MASTIPGVTVTFERVVDSGVRFDVPIAIAKAGIDNGKRTVRGIMTQEVVDSHGEEVDFESVKACLATWRGNIREMHQPKAVGKAVEIAVLDDLKAVEVESYVSRGAEDTWQKCLDGTLGFYSIGGVGDRVIGTRSDGTQGPRLLMRKIGELSLVDSGACPTSSISVVKLVDDVPTSQLSDDGINPASTSADTPTVEKALALNILKGLGFRSERWQISSALSVVAMLEEILTDECYETAYDSTAPDNAGQVELLRIAVEIVLDFVATEFAQQFASSDDFAKLSDADAVVVKSLVEKRGARHSKADVTLLQGMHDHSVKLGASCGVEKMDTKTEPIAEPAASVEPTPAPEKTETIVDAPAASAPAEVAKIEVVQRADVESIVADAVSKAVDAVSATFTTQIEELKTTSQSTIVKLQDRIEKLSAEPQNGGPVANAHASVIVEKGVDAQVVETLNDKGGAMRVISALEEIAKTETDPRTRQSLVEKSLALRMQHGLGEVLIPAVSQR